MTLKEMKIKVFSLIEEYYPELSKMAEDEDVLNKINGVINSIQLELMPYRKISATTTIEIAADDERTVNLKEFIEDLYQYNKIIFQDENIDYEMIDDYTISLPDDFEGEFTVYYYKYPELCQLIFNSDEESQRYDNTYEFELDNSLLEVMPYGVASDLLKMDMISNYGRYFYERYMDLKNSIDPRSSAGFIYSTGGTNI